METRPDRLPEAPWMRAPSTLAVVAALQAVGGQDAARFVGGCVRDTLLSLPAALATTGGRAALDVDIATPLPPAEVVAALDAAAIRTVPTGVDHGTVTAVSAGRPYEITTLRRDVETDGRHARVAFTSDWAEDAARRDFRLNALYAEPDGRLHDPTGGGIEDALAGRVVFVGEASTRIREDYLRILRFFRFNAWYGRSPPHVEGLAACAALAPGVRTLSAERVSRELLKMLGAPDPLPSIQAMEHTGVLAQLPIEADVQGLERLRGLEEALDLAPDAGLRLAALSTGDPARLARELRLPNGLRDRLLAAEPPLKARAVATPRAGRRLIYALGRKAFADRLLLSAKAGEAAEVASLLALAKSWDLPAFPLGGAEIKAAGVRQGPDVGRVRRAVEDWWITADFPDDPASLHAALDRAVAELKA